MSELRMMIDATPAAVSRVAETVRAFCLREGLSDAEAAMIELGSVEWMNNAVEHSYAGRPPGAIDVDIRIDPHEVTATIVDDGMPLDGNALLAHHAPQFDPADRASLPEGGFGLSIIRVIFDEVTFRRAASRNQVTLVRKREPVA